MADVAAFAFFCRRNSLLQASGRYPGTRLGRGIAFHSTPSNVPLNFAFSWVAGMLAGNANIVRLPRVVFEQEKLVCEAISSLLPAHGAIAPYVVMLRYSGAPELNDYFSDLCDVRIIWGGDQNIQNMRRSPLGPRACDVAFPDRYSILLIHADNYLLAKDKRAIARAFYNDTYLLDQNACASPSLIVWVGVEKEKAKEVFWQIAGEYVALNYEPQPIQMTAKFEAFCNAAAHGIPVHILDKRNWLITRVKVDRLDEGLMAHRCHSGFFFEFDADNLDDVYPVCGSVCQTATFYGFSREELACFIGRVRPAGIDRFVPIGRALDFSLVWDGVDLIEALSRHIEIGQGHA